MTTVKPSDELLHEKHGWVTVVRVWPKRRKAIVEDSSGERFVSDYQFLSERVIKSKPQPAPPKPTLRSTKWKKRGN